MKKNKFLSDGILFLLSLLLSLSIWVYVITVITPEDRKVFQNVQIELVGEDTITRMHDLVITDLDTTTVTLELKGPKRTLNAMDAEDLVAQVDVGKISLPGTRTLNYTIIYPNGVDRREIEVVAKSRDAVTCIVSKLTTRSIPVTGGYEGKTVSGYIQETPIFEPNVITISGPEDYVDIVDHAYVSFGKEETRSTTYSLDTGFTLMDKDNNPCSSEFITCSQDTIHATLPVLIVKEIPIRIGIEEGAGATQENTRVTIEPSTIKLAGDSSVLEGINSFTLNETIDLRSFSRNYSTVCPIPIPNGVRNLSGVTEATVTVEITGVEARTFEVSKDGIQFNWIGKPENVDVIVQSDVIPILLRGPSSMLARVRPQNIVAEADLSSYADKLGDHFVKLTITVPTLPGVGAIQNEGLPDYTVAISLVEKEEAP